tara:strand:+ start:135 stop:692 length:558 start_codon:yes stop_codon:yes gene_type:complete
LNHLLDIGNNAIIKNRLKQKIIFLLEKFWALIIKNIIGKLKNINGKLAALIKVDIPKNNAQRNKKYKEFLVYINLNKKYKEQENINKNIVSDKIWELIIIINGEQAAKKPAYNSYFLLIKPAHLKIKTQVQQSTMDCMTKIKNRFSLVNHCSSEKNKKDPGILSDNKLADNSLQGKYADFKDHSQ